VATRPTQFAGAQRDIKPGQLLSNAADWTVTPASTNARYVGNGKHKTYPPPSGGGDWTPVWRADGTTERCAQFSAEQWPELQRLAREAIQGGFIGATKSGAPYVATDGFPKRAWAWIGDTLHELRYSENGQYHGFPLTRDACYPLDPGQRLASAPRWRP